MPINRFTKRSLTRRLLAMAMITSLLLPGLSQAVPKAIAAVATEVSADPDEEIVYIDNAGAIRVLDTLQTGGAPVVDWVSPSTGWSNFALGDVNNDGDQEIIAIRGTSNGAGELKVFDPVVTNGAFDAQTPNGIPWATLYTTTIPGSPKLVATGKLDPNLPGDHIVYTYDLGSGSRMIVLKPAIPNPDGRQWAVHYTRDFDERWEQISVGNIDNEGADEMALIDDTVGRLSVYRSDANSEALMKKTGDSRPWRATTIAEYDQGSTIEVIGVRDAPPSLSSFFVFKWSKTDETFSEKDPESFSPSPRFVFGADINNDGKEAIVMLRSVSSDANAVRMIVRGDDGGEIPTELEQLLDSDNGYQTGAGGDVDGDGKDEIVIMRDNKIRIYTQPDRNASSNNYDLQTGAERIHIGDLDRNGFSIGPRFSTSISTIEETLQIGTTGVTRSFELRNETSSVPISFEIAIESNPSWFVVTPRFGNTPAVISYTPNAIGLAPGRYTSRIILTSNNNTVINQPYSIQVTLTVNPADISASPSALSFSYMESTVPMTLTQQASVTGATGVRFTAGVQAFPQIQAASASLGTDLLANGVSGYLNERNQIVAVNAEGVEVVLAEAGVNEVSWLTVAPATGTVPSLLTLSLHSELQPNDFERLYLVIIGDSRTGLPPQNVRLIPITALRASTQLFLPSIHK